jgi:8-oxo-dGTP diphosphatase
VYEAEIKEGEPVAKQHAQIKWVDIDELQGLDWTETDIPVCREFMKRTNCCKDF